MTPEQRDQLRNLILPLTWSEYDTSIGADQKYCLMEGRDSWRCVVYPFEGTKYRLVECVTRDAAQAAAQLDYADRIFAALDQPALLALLDTVRANADLMVREQEARRLLECALWVRGEGDADAARAWLGGAK